MSLINKVLSDIESRAQGARDSRASPEVLEGLAPTPAPTGDRDRPWLALAAALFGASALAVAALLFWLRTPVPAPVARPAVLPAPAAPAATAVAAPTPPQVTNAAPPPVQPVASPAPAPTPAARVAAAPRAPAVAAKPHIARSSAPAPRAEKRVVPATPPAPETAATPIDKTEHPLSPAEQNENRFRQAFADVQQGRMAEAEAALRVVLAQDPVHVKARELLVGVLLQEGRKRDAIDVLSAGIAATPRAWRFSAWLAQTLADDGQLPRALAVLDHARATGAKDLDLLTLAGAIYERAGRAADAANAYREALTLAPNDGRLWVGLGIALETQRHPQDATAAYERALALDIPPALGRFAEQRLASIKPKS